MDGGERDAMLSDLLTHHSLVGLRYAKMISLLGYPDEFMPDGRGIAQITDSIQASYLILQTWDVIDPDYNKYLDLTMDRDSIVRSIKIREWKHS